MPRDERELMLKRFKTWSLPKCIEKTAQDMQLLVRLRAADRKGFCVCCSCGVKQHYKQMNGGHFVSRAHKATILHPQNVHAQCVRCNVMDNTPGYAVFLEQKYGKDTVLGLMEEARKTKEWTREELVDLRIALRKEIKTHKERLGE